MPPLHQWDKCRPATILQSTCTLVTPSSPGSICPLFLLLICFQLFPTPCLLISSLLPNLDPSVRHPHLSCCNLSPISPYLALQTLLVIPANFSLYSLSWYRVTTHNVLPFASSDVARSVEFLQQFDLSPSQILTQSMPKYNKIWTMNSYDQIYTTKKFMLCMSEAIDIFSVFSVRENLTENQNTFQPVS